MIVILTVSRMAPRKDPAMEIPMVSWMAPTMDSTTAFRWRVDGTDEGSDEGDPDGVVDGWDDGSDNGDPDGIDEGFDDGDRDGIADGTDEGFNDGDPEGAIDIQNGDRWHKRQPE